MGVVLVVAACGAGAVDVTTTTPPQQLEGPFWVELSATVSGNSIVEVHGTTNLPDGTWIEISATQAANWVGMEGVRAVSLGRARATVEKGEFSESLLLDYGDLLIGLESDQDAILNLDSDTMACAAVQTGVDTLGNQRQPSAIEALLGPNGEALEGSPAVSVFGSATPNPSNWLKVSLPFTGLGTHMTDLVEEAQSSRVFVADLDGFCL